MAKRKRTSAKPSAEGTEGVEGEETLNEGESDSGVVPVEDAETLEGEELEEAMADDQFERELKLANATVVSGGARTLPTAPPGPEHVALREAEEGLREKPDKNGLAAIASGRTGVEGERFAPHITNFTPPAAKPKIASGPKDPQVTVKFLRDHECTIGKKRYRFYKEQTTSLPLSMVKELASARRSEPVVTYFVNQEVQHGG